MDKNRKTALVLFGRWPRPGRVKTRLIPALGEQGACDFYRHMLLWMITRFHHQNSTTLIVYLDQINPRNAPDFDLPADLSIKLQQGNDLGEKMYAAIKQELSDYRQVILFGSDCPFIDHRVMAQVQQVLGQVDICIVPAIDGGYVLIGARRITAKIFNAIAWGTEKVLRQTEDKLRQSNLRWQFLYPLPDIDTPQDLHVQREKLQQMGLWEGL